MPCAGPDQKNHAAAALADDHQVLPGSPQSAGTIKTVADNAYKIRVPGLNQAEMLFLADKRRRNCRVASANSASRPRSIRAVSYSLHSNKRQPDVNCFLCARTGGGAVSRFRIQDSATRISKINDARDPAQSQDRGRPGNRHFHPENYDDRYMSGSRS